MNSTLNAIKADNARYAAFASTMIAGLNAEIADIAKRDQAFTSRQIVSVNVDNNASTVRPVKAT